MSVFYVILVILRLRENASLFTTAAMVMYLIYLNWSALASRPNRDCNPFWMRDHGTILQILFGLIFTFLTLVILAFGSNSEGGGPESKLQKLAADDNDSKDELEEETRDGKKQEAHVFPISPATMIFQAFMIFVSIYYAMLISNWGRPTVDDDNYDYFIDEWAGFWVKIVDQWVMCGLYLFSLVAPKVFKDRDFS